MIIGRYRMCIELTDDALDRRRPASSTGKLASMREESACPRWVVTGMRCMLSSLLYLGTRPTRAHIEAMWSR